MGVEWGGGTCRPPSASFVTFPRLCQFHQVLGRQMCVCVKLHQFFYIDNLSGHRPKLSAGDRGSGGSSVTGPGQHSILSERHLII